MYRGKLDNNDFDDAYFPSYTAVNASAGVHFGKVTVAINGSNIFNALGIDEGNPRSIVSPVGQNAIFARPLLGRSIITRVTYQL